MACLKNKKITIKDVTLILFAFVSSNVSSLGKLKIYFIRWESNPQPLDSPSPMFYQVGLKCDISELNLVFSLSAYYVYIED